MPPAAARARSKLLTHGAPVLALVTAGFAGLVHLQSGKLEVRSAHKRALELGPTGTNALDLEAEAERLSHKLRIDAADYDNKPIPRWER